MRELSGRVAVVTGAGSGIGRALADRFAAEGMKVALADIEPEPLDAAVQAICATGASAIGVRTDVSQAEQIQALADATLDAFGAVHVVCNNAGVASGAHFSDIPMETWQWVLNVNLWGVLHGCRIFLPLIRRQGEGHIVNTASMAAFGPGMPTLAPYTVSKHGVLAVSQALEMELLSAGEEIGVSVLCPGLIRTRITDAERNRPHGITAGPDPSHMEVIRGVRTLLGERGMEPEDVAQTVVDAIRRRRFFALTHPDEAIAAVERQLVWMRTGLAPEFPALDRLTD
jgi:NAD(P)-dependent dehydrogenase (short-subunit alcohol dehydrogenase family)